MPRIAFVGIVLLLTAATIYRLFNQINTQPPVRWDEATNIAVVTHSRTRGSFLTLYIGTRPFFEKPPLWYALTSFIVSIAGTSIISYRLVSIISGFCVIILTAVIAFRWWGRIGLITSWICLLSTNQLFTRNPAGYFATHTFRSADVDALFVLLILASLLFCMNISKPYRWLAAGCFSGLAVLTKGPLGVIPLLATSAVFVLSPDRTKTHSIRKAWLAFVAVSLPWHMYMTYRFGASFLNSYVFYHLLTRALTPIEKHTSSWWFYIRLLGNHNVFASWEILAGSIVFIAAKRWYTDIRILLLLIVFFSFLAIPTIAQTRLAWYVLPTYPLAALIIAGSLSHLQQYFSKT